LYSISIDVAMNTGHHHNRASAMLLLPGFDEIVLHAKFAGVWRVNSTRSRPV
jgi:hypothetical protein